MAVRESFVDISVGLGGSKFSGPGALPSLGDEGQVLSKDSSDSFDVVWRDATASPVVLKGPALTYSGGVLTSITYDDGTVRTLNYTSNVLTSVVTVYAGGPTVTKTLNYSGGVLTSVDEVST